MYVKKTFSTFFKLNIVITVEVWQLKLENVVQNYNAKTQKSNYNCYCDMIRSYSTCNIASAKNRSVTL